MAETGWPLIPREVLPAPVAAARPAKRRPVHVDGGRQLSIFGAETTEPSPADLVGLLVGPGRLGRIGGTARVSVEVDAAWRVHVLVSELVARGLVVNWLPIHAEEQTPEDPPSDVREIGVPESDDEPGGHSGADRPGGHPASGSPGGRGSTGSPRRRDGRHPATDAAKAYDEAAVTGDYDDLGVAESYDEADTTGDYDDAGVAESYDEADGMAGFESRDGVREPDRRGRAGMREPDGRGRARGSAGRDVGGLDSRGAADRVEDHGAQDEGGRRGQGDGPDDGGAEAGHDRPGLAVACFEVRTAYSSRLNGLARAWPPPADRLFLSGPRLRLWVAAAGEPRPGGYALRLDPVDNPEIADSALARAGLAGTVSDHGRYYLISGKKRLRRLAELVGERPAAAPDGLWPSGAPA